MYGPNLVRPFACNIIGSGFVYVSVEEKMVKDFCVEVFFA